MTRESPGSRLNLISTRWSVVRQALHGSIQGKRSAQEQVLECYGKAIRRYLLGAVHDPDAADELFQSFAQRFVEGKLSGADPARGRFRDFIKGVLSNLTADYFTRRARDVAQQHGFASELSATAQNEVTGSDFAECCRDELLARTWAALANVENETGQPVCAVLRLRVEAPDMRSPEMAEVLSQRLSRPITPVAVRQTLHRARERFADLLLGEVIASLVRPTYAELEQELVDLRLLTYCQPALDRRGWEG